jgi:UDPglucose 6-dehydrogenase
LQELVTRQNYSGRLFYTVDLNELVNFADVLILAVGTPPTKDGTADLSAIYDVSLLIGNQMKSDKTVIIKSCKAIVDVESFSSFESRVFARRLSC